MPYSPRLPSDFPAYIPPRYPQQYQDPAVNPTLRPRPGYGFPPDMTPELPWQKPARPPRGPELLPPSGATPISSTSPSQFSPAWAETAIGTWPESQAKRLLWADQLLGGRNAPRSAAEGMGIQSQFRQPNPELEQFMQMLNGVFQQRR